MSDSTDRSVCLHKYLILWDETRLTHVVSGLKNKPGQSKMCLGECHKGKAQISMCSVYYMDTQRSKATQSAGKRLIKRSAKIKASAIERIMDGWTDGRIVAI